ncbi:hypothetical protein EFQ99_21205 [Rhizobium vallis]|uniref:Uncharacterized protein n=1 Tax=Rhizobium vallis TaxID=634290 RepID=A0A432PHB9_9HYPH|nr:hypothetical protein [Rhizobium vallis]RUM23780.1 hypothetical protein EFQ99_21205 [Rhizobium vallis]
MTLERKLIDIIGQLDRLMQALTRGILPIEAIETQYIFLEAERARITVDLEKVPRPQTIELHPQAVGQYKRTVENLSARLSEMDEKSGAEIFASFRELVHSVSSFTIASTATSRSSATWQPCLEAAPKYWGGLW